MLVHGLKFIMVRAVILMSLTTSVFASSHPLLVVANPPFTLEELGYIKQYLFDNITTEEHTLTKEVDGRLIHSKPGAVLASPSKQDQIFSQDYQFHWVRDAAITMNTVVQLYAQAAVEDKKKLKQYLLNYVDFESIAQKQVSKAGEETLGQPKYNIDATIWEGDWGRPQNDGPALRAIAITAIAKLAMQEGEQKRVREKLLEMVLLDLDYVASRWQNTTFDLWEEVNDPDHFFTKMVQRKALLEGAALARQFGKVQQADYYTNTARQITSSLQKHWNPNVGYASETVNQQYYKGGGMNISIILGALYGDIHDPNDPFALTSDSVLSSAYFLRNAFAPLYKINITNKTAAPLIGRYPGDIYDGNHSSYGNPWVLTTNALAQYYYALAKNYLGEGSVRITHNNIFFFQQFYTNLDKEEVILASEQPDKFFGLVNRLIEEGDNSLKSVKRYATCYADRTCYHLSEQIDRASGKPRSARDLTWNYASLLDAMRTRAALGEVVV
ncbi:hypothetical protein AQULUS_12390 [Aquicella lusitana]|uniref:glucan 1,4-alpha-glucosidase n=2 Tax=Aquicella lusitana TaxID=254246 RepID=A0A370GJC9_9COXI|nr:glucoamylase [Aquicella lusitana]VVC73496.1 hypothetical protein AQULUS_12390 [Aquicella lusitana]